jgi:hypothetical protein
LRRAEGEQAYVLHGVRFQAFYLLRVPRVRDTLLVLLALVSVNHLDDEVNVAIRIFNAILCILRNDIIPAICL